ncbi:MAG: hypothetical protein QM788_09880 [Roseateles sp.]|uniref:hypothetical protein n=1 Tax=Roseateles sp. TaxID=1971397 RepID=UPI0039E952A7
MNRRASALQKWVAACLAAVLVGCGGGGGNAGAPVVGPGSGSSSPTGGGATATAADLVVVLSKSTLDNSGTDSITATVTSIDANRVAVGGVPVSFAVNANALVTPSGTATAASTGALTATVTQGADTTPRPVTLTVTSGSVTREVTFTVVQASTTTNPQANDLTLTLSASSIDNSGSKTVTATATAVDAYRNALAGIPVQLSVTDGSAFIAPSGGNQTNASGQVSGVVSIGQDRLDRTVTVVATSGTLTRTAAFQITGTKFATANPVPAVPVAGSPAKVVYTLTDVNSNPLAGAAITVSGTGGIAGTTGTTDLNGSYTFDYVTPSAPGTTLTISAAAGKATSEVLIAIPGGGSSSVPVAATPVATTLNLSADVVAVNTADTSNQVTVNAFFRDGNNAPVPYVRVLFGVAGDNGTGTLGAGAHTVLSDASGNAATSYRPGAVSSPTNGVTLRACWKTTDFAAADTAANCAAAGGTLLTTTLTIVSNPVAISIGTDNTISNGPSGLTYVKKFVVLVVDSAGNPKPDVQITPSLDLGGYGKGGWAWNPAAERWERAPDGGHVYGALTATCANEDLNRNGVIDAGEDINGSKQLEPRKSDVAITLVGATRTDANGVAVLQLEYPQSLGSWVRYKITVTAAGVLSPPAYYPMGLPVALPSRSAAALGSEAAVRNYLNNYAWLPVSGGALSAESPPPAFVVSPYGTAGSCTDAQ